FTVSSPMPRLAPMTRSFAIWASTLQISSIGDSELHCGCLPQKSQPAPDGAATPRRTAEYTLVTALAGPHSWRHQMILSSNSISLRDRTPKEIGPCGSYLWLRL